MSHNKKQLTKDEILGWTASQFQQVMNILHDINIRLIALSRSKITPEALAHFTLEKEANADFIQRLNLEIDKQIKLKHEQENNSPSVDDTTGATTEEVAGDE